MTKIRKNSISNNRNKKRLENISIMLREIRYTEGLCQDELSDYGLTRRQVQRGEHGRKNLTLNTLFNLIDSYGYSLGEFFEGME